MGGGVILLFLFMTDYKIFREKNQERKTTRWQRILQALFSEFQETPLVIGDSGIVWSKEEDAHNT